MSLHSYAYLYTVVNSLRTLFCSNALHTHHPLRGAHARVYYLLHMHFDLRCLRFLWLGRESTWLTCLPHYPTRCHTLMSLLINASPSLHCLGYTVRTLRRLRHPMVQHHCTPSTIEILPRFLQLTPHRVLAWLSCQILASY